MVSCPDRGPSGRLLRLEHDSTVQWFYYHWPCATLSAPTGNSCAWTYTAFDDLNENFKVENAGQNRNKGNLNTVNVPIIVLFNKSKQSFNLATFAALIQSSLQLRCSPVIETVVVTPLYLISHCVNGCCTPWHNHSGCVSPKKHPYYLLADNSYVEVCMFIFPENNQVLCSWRFNHNFMKPSVFCALD